jgi:hypothetical protein
MPKKNVSRGMLGLAIRMRTTWQIGYAGDVSSWPIWPYNGDCAVLPSMRRPAEGTVATSRPSELQNVGAFLGE